MTVSWPVCCGRTRAAPTERLGDLLALVEGGYTLAQRRAFDGYAVALLLAGQRLSCTWEGVSRSGGGPGSARLWLFFLMLSRAASATGFRGWTVNI